MNSSLTKILHGYCFSLIFLWLFSVAYAAEPVGVEAVASEKPAVTESEVGNDPSVNPPSEPADLKPKKLLQDTIPTSIMFSVEDVDSVNTIIRAISAGQLRNPDSQDVADDTTESTKDMLDEILNKIPRVGQSEAVPTRIIYPSFFLSSIIYERPDEWAIWLNGFRLTNKMNKETDPLYVTEISPESVRITWKPDSVMLLHLGSIAVQQKDDPDKVPIDAVNKSITFTLRPNQTFVSSILSVEEGRIPSVTVQLASAEGAGSGVGPDPSIPAQAPPFSSFSAPFSAPPTVSSDPRNIPATSALPVQ